MFTRVTTIIIAILLTAVSATAQQRPKVKPREAQVRNLAPKKPPTLTLEVTEVTPVTEKVKRASERTVCAGDRVVLRVRSAEPNITPSKYAWVATGGKIIGDGAEVIFDTTGLPAGDYHITGEALYAGLGECSGDCAAYDTKTVRVTECAPAIICFTSPAVVVTPDVKKIKACESVTFNATEVTGGQGFGQVAYTWKTTAGKLTTDGLTARLDTCGVAPGTEIEVTVKALSEFANCEAKGLARVLLAIPPPPSRELTPCTTFKRHNARVDNACKFVLSDTVRAMQSDPQARLVIDAYSNPGEASSLALARGRNVRDRLVDGSVGVAIDANRIIVRTGGVASDASQVKLHFVPEGATMPEGGQEVKLGPVESEKKTSDDELQSAKPKRKPRH